MHNLLKTVENQIRKGNTENALRLLITYGRVLKKDQEEFTKLDKEIYNTSGVHYEELVKALKYISEKFEKPDESK